MEPVLRVGMRVGGRNEGESFSGCGVEWENV